MSENTASEQQQPQTPPPAPAPVPQHVPPQHPAQPSPGELAGLMTAINGLPERIVNSIREATPTPAPPEPPKQESPKQEPLRQEDKQPGNRDLSTRERFVSWWGVSH